MVIPDLAGFTFEEAKNILLNSGFIIHKIEITSPPRKKTSGHDSYFRVIRVKLIEDNKIELLLCDPKTGMKTD